VSAPDAPVLAVETRCRGCGAPAPATVLELGEVPLANALLAPGDLGRPEARFPLTLAFCPGCSLVQIRETVRPDVLFRHYLYFSSFSETMLAHAREQAETLIRRVSLGPRSLVVEIASNDGYLLQNFVGRGIPVLGCEPARNVAEVAERRGVRTVREFFGLDLARRLASEGVRADALVGNNVLAHVADLHGLAEGVGLLLAPGGVAVFEFPYVADMVGATEFDTIYHEHLCYFSLHAARSVFARHGLFVVDVERHAIHGGSLRVFLARDAAPASPAVGALLDEEAATGVTAEAYYRRFAGQVARLRDRLLRELRGRKAAGQRLAAYGASAKGSTLMNAFGIGADLLDFVVDRSTVKQGLHTPGNRLPILPPGALLERRPDAVLLLTWNFAEEIFRQQRAFLESGGTFVVPVPEVRCVGAEVLA
jgi:SAM-dependent methyltransferase